MCLARVRAFLEMWIGRSGTRRGERDLHGGPARQEQCGHEREHRYADGPPERVSESSGYLRGDLLSHARADGSATACDRVGSARELRGDLPLEDDSEKRRPDRSTDALENVYGRGGARHLCVVEVLIRGGDRRHHREAEPDASHEERDREERVARGCPDGRVRERSENDYDQPDRHDPARPEAIRKTAGAGHDEGGPDPLRCDEQSGDERALAAVHLVVERKQDESPEEGGTEAERGERCRKETSVGEEVHVDEWFVDAAFLVVRAIFVPRGDANAAINTIPIVERYCDGSAGPGDPELAQPVDNRREAGGKKK